VTALSLEGIAKSRGSGRRAVRVLHDVSLTLSRGEVVLLQGPSGAGKTTLLALAAGLLLPDAGRVSLDGVSPSNLSPAERRHHRARRVGFVFQHSNLLDQLTVRENVLVMAALAGLAPPDARAATDELLEVLGIARLTERLPRELSGGEEQRVVIARALVHCPTIVLADEPTGSLDGASGAVVARLLADTARSRGATVLVATHDQRLEAIASRTVRLLDGRIVDA
jgi:ABC-type lipoprotein export system ATPase subunit